MTQRLQKPVIALPDPDVAPGRAVVIYDGACLMCRSQMRFLRRLDVTDELAFLSLWDERVTQRYPELSREKLLEEMVLVDTDESRHGGARAVRRISRLAPLLWPLAALLHLPGSLPLWTRLYKAVARARYRFGKADCGDACEIHFGSPPKKDGPSLKSFLFLAVFLGAGAMAVAGYLHIRGLQQQAAARRVEAAQKIAAIQRTREAREAELLAAVEQAQHANRERFELALAGVQNQLGQLRGVVEHDGAAALLLAHSISERLDEQTIALTDVHAEMARNREFGGEMRASIDALTESASLGPPPTLIAAAEPPLRGDIFAPIPPGFESFEQSERKGKKRRILTRALTGGLLIGSAFFPYTAPLALAQSRPAQGIGRKLFRKRFEDNSAPEQAFEALRDGRVTGQSRRVRRAENRRENFLEGLVSVYDPDL